MNRKKRIPKLVYYTLIAIALLYLFQCKRQNSTVINPNLLAAHLEFQLPETAGKRFKELIAGNNHLAKIFKPGGINIFYKKNQWIGRIRHNDISYHALFTINNSKIICKTTHSGAGGLHFSIYHPSHSQLSYSISVENQGTRENIFSKSYKEESFFDVYIPFKKKPKER